ncbi:BACON domain-containing protein [Streptomyces fulvoviolaceus]|uniref:BACON domain-containing protein n=1 Tax=Streptomyces fulvoviolaceus TaxID=285535 RepID=UPI0004C9C36D|nr:sigma-70 family RNA polymerase sigma factor [Streptomyces fulvoviolaceus]
MMSSSPETSTRTTGAHRSHREARDRAAARTLAQRTPARYEPYLDGLFTYCLSVLCDHDAATAALGDVLALAEKRHGPEAAGDRRAWLYALARWACLRKLAEAKQKRQATHAAGRHSTEKRRSANPPVSDEVREQRRRELAQLAWPEAAGTTPEQREALELAVRHHLAAHEVAAALGMDLATARELLASAACEVERTRAALAVVETGGCPGVARLTGDNQLVLSAAVRKELVRHVDDCPRCRRSAERAIPGRWPGAMITPAELPVLEAPRAALHVAMAHLPRARAAAPRFDRRGFPMDPKDRAARRDRLRARAVTTTVVATVVAAPVLALWAAYRGAPTGEGPGGGTASASEAHGPDSLDGEAAGTGYENAGNASAKAANRFTKDGKPDVSVEVISVSGVGKKGAGNLEVAADNSGDTTLVTLTATGDAPVRWSATTSASWLYLSQSSGTLEPGESLTIKVYVDHLREPAGYWTARVAISPAGAVISIEGYGPAPTPSDPGPTAPSDPPPSSSDPDPTTPPPTEPTDPPPSEEPPPSSPDPEPTDSTPTDPSPSAPESSTPPPGDSGDPSPSTS